jgi:hypothetical protein
VQQAQIRGAVQQDIANFGSNLGVQFVSPYPAISQQVYGDPGFGWVLAGINLLASQQRGDNTLAIRNLAYVGSNVDNLNNIISAGKFFIPNDMSAVQAAVASSLSSYGVAQTLLNIFDGVGLTLFIGGKDDPTGFSSTTNISTATGAVITKIISAVDPQTATLDPHLLVASLNTKVQTTGQQYKASSSDFVTSPQVFGNEINTVAPSLDTIVGSEIIDLTTYVGITSLMEIIRTVYDFYPGVLS